MSAHSCEDVEIHFEQERGHANAASRSPFTDESLAEPQVGAEREPTQ
jgi:hypothetical protein